MKKTIFLWMVGLMLVLSACGGSASSSDTNTASETTSVKENALLETTELMIGTMLLDETDFPVEAEQAVTLLKLWKAYQSVLNSETSAEVEIEAVFKQVKAEMTSEQIAAIEAMGLTSDNLQEKMQSLGVAIGGMAMMGGEQDPSVAATMQALRESGEMPNMEGMPEIPYGEGGNMPQGGGPQGGNMPQGGGPQGGNMSQGGVMPDAGGMMMGIEGEEMDSAQLATLQAQRSERSGQGEDRFLLNALIQFLDAKVSS